MEKYDVIVIGGGPCGNSTALRLAKKNKKVCLIENNQNHIGGTCLNEGCMPVKALLKSADVYANLLKAENFGYQNTVHPINFPEIKNKTEQILIKLRRGIDFLYKQAKLSVFYGNARLIDVNTVEIDHKQKITADNIVIATGSITKELPGFEVDNKLVFSSTSLLNTRVFPTSIAIIGGGYVGTEFATMYRKWGVEVYLIEFLPQLLNFEDQDIVRVLEREFKKSGIKIFTDSICRIVKTENKQVLLEVQTKNSDLKEEILVQQVLLANGRKPELSFYDNHIKFDITNGFLNVNDKLQTSIPHIYAGGDVINTPMLAHVGVREGLFIADQILGLNKYHLTDKVPRVIFTDPEIGAIGYTEKQLVALNIEYDVFQEFFRSNGKAVLNHQETGLVKILVEKNSEKILGASIIGPSATELIHELVLAVQLSLTKEQLKQVMHAHPTLIEIIGDAV